MDFLRSQAAQTLRDAHNRNVMPESEIAEDLRGRIRALLAQHEFNAGDLVRFKPGCAYGNMKVAAFVRMIPNDAVSGACEIAAIDTDGDLAIFRVDVRRLEPWSAPDPIMGSAG